MIGPKVGTLRSCRRPGETNRGPDRQALTQSAEKLGLASAVVFTGRQTAAEVRRWLQVADVFTLVSSLEGFSCSLVEAMSVGLPSVVSAIPANLQLIDAGVYGLHAPVRNQELLVGAISQLLETPPIRAAMGKAARQRVLENYSVDKLIDRYESLLYKALAKRQ
jgi:glycosyltransferase involved in cell wall biosynthesis